MYKVLYNILFIPLLWIAFHLALPFHRKVREGAKGRKETLSKAGAWRKDNSGKLIAIHSASAGEFEASIPLIKELKSKYIQVVATFFSPSGYRHGEELGIADLNLYLPFEAKSAVEEFLTALHPSMFIICKHDIWPNLVWECQSKGIPLLLINTNLHPRSFRINPLFIGFNRAVFGQFEKIYTVSDEHSERLRKLLPGKDNLEVVGDTRFDRVMERLKGSVMKLPLSFEADPVFIAGSVWPAESFTMEIFMEFRQLYPAWRLIWVPHEPVESNLQWAERRLTAAGLKTIRLTQLRNDDDCQAIIVDKMGVLAGLYRYGDIVYIGGGFGKGVHSVIEPAVFGLPVIFGPHHFVSAEAGELLKRGGGFTIKSVDEFRQIFRKLGEEEDFRLECGKIAGAMVQEKTGATQIIANKIAEIL